MSGGFSSVMPGLVARSRSIRRFDGQAAIDPSILTHLVDVARLCPSAANKQPLKYCLSWEPRRNEAIFECLAWAAYLKDWAGPAKGERPTGYIIILGDTGISSSFAQDSGIAAQTIMLAAAEMGLGGCIIGSINRERLAERLHLPAQMEILLVLALGKPAEKVILEEVRNGDVKYWRDAAGFHHVPKRSLQDIIISI